MKYSELRESRVQKLEVEDWFHKPQDLVLVWNPSPKQAANLAKRAAMGEIRVLLVGQQMVVWDAKYVEHRDVIRALALPQEEYQGRDKKLFIGIRKDGFPWISARAAESSNPEVQRLIRAGYNLGSGEFLD